MAQPGWGVFLLLEEMSPTAYVTTEEFDQFKALVASTEDLLFTTRHDFDTAYAASSGGFTEVLFAAPFDMEILSLDLAGSHGSVPASTADYWSYTLVRVPADGSAVEDMIVKTTEEDPLSSYECWTFDGQAWLQRNLAKGDVVRFNLRPSGNPSDWPREHTLTVRYRRRVVSA